MTTELRHELTEEELLELLRTLNKLSSQLFVESYGDREAISELASYMGNRLKEIAWRKYQKENGL